MLSILDGLKGVDELETKILEVNAAQLEQKFRKIGMCHEGVFTIKEQRYIPTAEMKREKLSARLRRLRGGGDRVELVIKKKHPNECVTGQEHLGVVLKHRTEFEVEICNTAGTECRYKLMQAFIKMCGLQKRETIKTQLTCFSHEGVRFELQRILEHSDGNSLLPPTFLEIEGPDSSSIIQAVNLIDFRIENLCALTKREVIQEYRQKKCDR